MTLQESNQKLAKFADTQLDIDRCNEYSSKISDGYYSKPMISLMKNMLNYLLQTMI